MDNQQNQIFNSQEDIAGESQNNSIEDRAYLLFQFNENIKIRNYKKKDNEKIANDKVKTNTEAV